MQKYVYLVYLGESFPTSIYLQKSASIQKRTGPMKFAHLTGKSEKGSISNLSTKVATDAQKEQHRAKVRQLGTLVSALQSDALGV